MGRPLTVCFCCGFQSPMSNACETMRVPGFNSFISLGASFRLSGSRRYSVTTVAGLMSAVNRSSARNVTLSETPFERALPVASRTRSGSMSIPTPRAPYVFAAETYGARGVGIDIDPERVREATGNARSNGVSDKVTFRAEDLFTADISPATVVTLYLLEPLNLKLAPKLMKELKPGTRIVSHAFDMGDWKPQQKQTVSGRPIYLWTIP